MLAGWGFASPPRPGLGRDTLRVADRVDQVVPLLQWIHTACRRRDRPGARAVALCFLFQHLGGGVLTSEAIAKQRRGRRCELVVPSYCQPRQWNCATVLASRGTRASSGAAPSSTLSCSIAPVALPDGSQHRRLGLSARGSGLGGGGIDSPLPRTPSPRAAFDRGAASGLVFYFSLVGHRVRTMLLAASAGGAIAQGYTA